MKLAINGGDKVRKKLFPIQETVGTEERRAADSVFDRGILSGYRGSAGPNFRGGYFVKKLEEEFIPTLIQQIKKINPLLKSPLEKVKDYKAIAINSCTSGLQMACNALAPFGEKQFLVTPWSMSCSATAPMVNPNAEIVFMDIEKDHFCISSDQPKKVFEKIKPNNISISVDLFGQPYDKNIQDKFGSTIIEDAAQSLGGWEEFEEGSFLPCGMAGDVGVFSFTQGKLLTAGEGGIVLASGDAIERIELLRNHSESVIHSLGNDHHDQFSKNLMGYNLRMTEIQASILCEQIKKIAKFVIRRNHNVEKISKKLEGIPGLRASTKRDNCGHAYYVFAMHYDSSKMDGVSRDRFVEAIKAELTEETGRIDRGVPVNPGYITPLYKFPFFESHGYRGYSLPNVESLQNDELIITLYQNLNLSDDDIDDIGNAFHKVYDNLEELK